MFFKAADTAAVKDWYKRVLDLDFTDWGAVMFANPDKGFQQLCPFAADTGHFKPSNQPFMLNLIVDDLDEVLWPRRWPQGRRRSGAKTLNTATSPGSWIPPA